MENDQGDLTDIIHGGGLTPTASSIELSASDHWPLPSDLTTFAPSSSTDDFGNPFPNFQDPIFNGFFLLSNQGASSSISNGDGFNNGGKAHVSSSDQDVKNNKPCYIFPKIGVAQMSTSGVKPSPLSPREICPYPLMSGRGSISLPAMDGAGGLQQISSPRTTGMKRRKNQAKKVICIPAPPGTTGGKPAAEAVPSDLWAWRKYGQKPIKGSPYPRGYYRCSSSKGCLARKQVERSRTNPNMLVITYTSEHNHAWPTQRNALAGSTRSQPAKNISSNASNIRSQSENEERQVRKQEPNEEIETKTNTTNTTFIVKERQEIGEKDKCIDPLQGDEFGQEFLMDHYKPMIPESSQPDDFFADLQELEADPMNLIFTKEYMESKPENMDKGGNNKGSLDLFNLLEWGEGGSMK